MLWARDLVSHGMAPLESVEEQLFALMLIVRGVEGSIERAHRGAQITGSFHSSLGQESCAAGVSIALRDDDVVTSNHRGHGHALGKGVSAEAVIAEMYRRTNGASGGRGGSMHIHDRNVGFLGETAIVGGGLSWAAGAAWARRRKGDDSIGVAFAGDGAFANGVFAEAIRVADFWSSPCLFVCENNGWAHSMPAETVFGEPGSITRVVDAMGVRAETIDGRDARKVFQVASDVIDYVRQGHTAFLEVIVHRVKAHSVNDADYRYRPKHAGQEWLDANDPIELLRESIPSNRQGMIEEAVQRVVEDASARASAGPLPDPSDAMRHIYASPDLSAHGRT
jgi:TPP-dependent pyruvate/acetoin dehydrogenase alpha subunit